MILAHLPAGYILGRMLGQRRGKVMIAALLGSVLPDLELLYAFAFGTGPVGLARSWLHLPAFWLGVALVALAMCTRYWPAHRRLVWVFLAAILLHLMLDNLSDGVMWFWPLSDRMFRLVLLPPTPGSWLIQLVLHWSFLAEALIITLAFWLYRKSALK